MKNLKEQIFHKKEQEKSGPLFPHSLPPQYTSSATQAGPHLAAQKLQAQVREEQKKMENARKPAQIVMQKRTQKQVTENRDAQKESDIRNKLKKVSGHVPFDSFLENGRHARGGPDGQ